jgi:hypothetical protein
VDVHVERLRPCTQLLQQLGSHVNTTFESPGHRDRVVDDLVEEEDLNRPVLAFDAAVDMSTCRGRDLPDIDVEADALAGGIEREAGGSEAIRIAVVDLGFPGERCEETGPRAIAAEKRRGLRATGSKSIECGFIRRTVRPRFGGRWCVVAARKEKDQADGRGRNLGEVAGANPNGDGSFAELRAGYGERNGS